jgi:biphenyl-2,3-diol 1,2-dioxygenase
MNHLELGYLVIETDKVDETNTILGEVVGLMPGETADGAATWRNDDRARRIVLQAGPANDIVAIGLTALSRDVAAELAGRVAALGFEVTEGSEEACALRGVGTLWHTMSPWGVRIEIVTEQRLTDDPLTTPLVPGGFLTSGMGLGHGVFFVPDLDAAHQFLVDGLGFARTDSLHLTPAPGIDVWGGFYHCNGRHHTIALIQPPFPAPAVFHHVMFEVNDIDDVGAAFDRACAAGVPLPNGLGRHPNDKMFSFYLQTPSGFQVEVGYGGVVVGDGWDLDVEYDQISAWGHRPVAQA